MDLSVDVVKSKVSNLRKSAAPGPDGIYPRVLCETARTISPILTEIFKKSLDSGTVPWNWTSADVVPIYKKGGKEIPGNYRPVSLTSIPCKVLESIIRDEMMEHLQSRGLLADAQHGFRPGRSCATQLMMAIEEWSCMIEKGLRLSMIEIELLQKQKNSKWRRCHNLRKQSTHQTFIRNCNG